MKKNAIEFKDGVYINGARLNHIIDFDLSASSKDHTEVTVKFLAEVDGLDTKNEKNTENNLLETKDGVFNTTEQDHYDMLCFIQEKIKVLYDQDFSKAFIQNVLKAKEDYMHIKKINNN